MWQYQVSTYGEDLAFDPVEQTDGNPKEIGFPIPQCQEMLKRARYKPNPRKF